MTIIKIYLRLNKVMLTSINEEILDFYKIMGPFWDIKWEIPKYNGMIFAFKYLLPNFIQCVLK
ncbi:hypothetical protein JOC86_000790 [Bacillus pakistanensis]|uniref:Uncharacterized protein n=1 Tax=Rossellomorea pakistanensis TaxID=992288 RepID=A0ABS2N8S2_9BACI|nr:hypothetical protein [Bacillus pakistanensis]